DAPRREPARQEHRHRRDQLEGAAHQDRGARRGGGRGGRRDVPARLRPARTRLLVPPDTVHQRLAVAPDRARGDLRAGAVDPHVPNAGRGGREGEQHPLRPFRRDLDREGLADPVDGRAPEGRRGVGEHVQPVRPDVAVRRVQGKRVRARGWLARARALPGARRVTTKSRVPVRRTAKLFIAGEFPRSESGRSYEVLSHDGRLLARAARASRKDLRDAVRAARAAQPEWAGKTAYNRAQILYRVAELMEGRRSQFESELADAGAKDPRQGRDAPLARLGLDRG